MSNQSEENAKMLNKIFNELKEMKADVTCIKHNVDWSNGAWNHMFSGSWRKFGKWIWKNPIKACIAIPIMLMFIIFVASRFILFSSQVYTFITTLPI